jgi:hypothetical protein
MKRPQKRRSQPVRAGSNQNSRLGGRDNSTAKRDASQRAWLRDLQLERRIKRLGSVCAAAHAAGNREAEAKHWNEMREAIGQRSPEQIQRMEARFGLRIRRQMKASLVFAFCHGWMLAAAVATTFRLFHLGGV